MMVPSKNKSSDNYKKSQGQSPYWQLLLTACASAVLFLMLCAIRGLFPLGDGSVLMIDLHSQYTPLLYRFYDVVTGQKNLFMDFSVSGGANLYADTINEVINPFNYLLLFFGRERIYLAINVLLGAYVTAAAVSMNFLLLRLWPKTRQWNLVFSIVYGFSGFAAYQFQIIKWMIFPVIFPLFVLAGIRLIRKKKGGWYAVLLAYQLMLNLQLGAMTLFATLFGSGLYFFFCMKKEERKQAMCRLAVYTILGTALSAAVLWPGLVYLLKSARGGENSSYFAVMKQHGLDDLFERLFLTVHPVLLGMFVFFAAKWILGHKKGVNRWKSMAGEEKFLISVNGLLLFTVLAQPSNLLWHLGSYMCFPVRYAYIVLLAAVCFLKWKLADCESSREEEQKQGLQVWQLVCGVVSCVLCTAVLYVTLREADQITQAFSTLAISRVCPEQTLLVCMILGILTVAALLAFGVGKQMRSAMTVVAFVSSLCLFLFILLPQDYAVRMMNEDAYETMDAMYRELKNESAADSGQSANAAGNVRQDSDGFVRVPDDADLPLNAALITGSSTLTGYFPAGSQLVYAQGLEQLGYLTPWVSTRSWGGTMISDGMLGLNKEETVMTFGGALILDGDAEQLAKGTQLAAQQGSLALQAYMGEVLCGEKVLDILTGNESYAAAEEGLQISVKGRKALYLDAGVSADQILVLVNGEMVQIPESGSAEGPHRLIYLGTWEEQEIVLQIKNRQEENFAEAAYASVQVGVLDLDTWKQNGETVKDSRSVVIQKEKNSMYIDVSTLDVGQTLFVPMAAIDGWQCKADGEIVEITPVLGGFMGITLQETAEALEFSFYPPGLKIGLVISAAALVLLAVGQTPVIVFFAGCYKAVWIIGFLLVYVVPNVGMVCFMIYRILKG